jgi:DNA polymerase-1
MYLIVAPAGSPGVARDAQLPPALIQPVDAHGVRAADAVVVGPGELAQTVRRMEGHNVRWVWESTRSLYPELLSREVSVGRCRDLALSREILARSPYCADTPYIENLRTAIPADSGDPQPRQAAPAWHAAGQSALFDEPPGAAADIRSPEETAEELAAEFARQQDAVARSTQPQRLGLLLAAESAGALLAAELEAAGIPWHRRTHEELLEAELGPRPADGQRPHELEKLAGELREKLGSPMFNPDSPQELLRALHRAGIDVRSTRSWELERQQHPAIAPLLRYRKLSRLHTANGWAWLDAWIRDGRFRPEYVVGGVVSGRWASRGGGALQIPQQVRGAVRPAPGYRLVVADAAQLEPRILAALGRDSALARAAAGKDLYEGIAGQGFGGDRSKAKLAMLGAMYGATKGESGRLMPALARAYPQAVAVLEGAARTGEAGGVVSSHLGRGCPPASAGWLAAQQSTTAEEQRRADALARSRGRFTRNFVVQATAAEWALCWLAEIRRRLRAGAAPGAELVFFLHDEVMLHVPDPHVDNVAVLIPEAAEAAARLLFGRVPVSFPVGVAVVDRYADAKPPALVEGK